MTNWSWQTIASCTNYKLPPLQVEFFFTIRMFWQCTNGIFCSNNNKRDMCMCCAFRSLVGALLKGRSISPLGCCSPSTTCHMHYLQHQIWGSNLKERADLGAWLGGGGQGKERRADMVKPSPDVQEKAPRGWHVLSKIRGLGRMGSLPFIKGKRFLKEHNLMCQSGPSTPGWQSLRQVQRN